MACITTTEGRRDATRAVWMEKVASTRLSSGSKCQVRKLHASTSSLNHDVDVGRRRRLDELLQEASGFFAAGKLFLPQHQVEVAGRGRYRQMGGELEGDAADGSPGAAAMAEDGIDARERRQRRHLRGTPGLASTAGQVFGRRPVGDGGERDTGIEALLPCRASHTDRNDAVPDLAAPHDHPGSLGQAGHLSFAKNSPRDWTKGARRASHREQCPSYSLCWAPCARRSEPAPTSRLRTWRSGNSSPC